MPEQQLEGQGRRVILVDDDLAALRVVELALGERGYAAAAATSARKALELIDVGGLDGVISETALPEMDGFDLLDEIRKRPATATIPFVFLTVDRSLKGKEEGFRRGVDEYVTKPCVIEEFFARLAGVIRRREAAAARWAPPGTPEEGWDFSGGLIAIGLGPVLQELVKGMKEGLLSIRTTAGQGDVYIKGGKVYHAALPEGEEGAEALGRLCAATHLAFDFRAGETCPKETVNTPIDNILLRLMQGT